MARKQSDYLASLLASEEVVVVEEPGTTAPEPQRPRPTTLLHRESALARVASGEVRQVTQLLLDPARVRIWPGNARVYEHLSEEGCRELIDSIIAEGGQKVPAVVRRVEGHSSFDYEVIAGTRRHWAISWLRAHSYPDLRFLAQVADLDDEAAFRLADLENRARKDVSDFERARNYAEALDRHYGGRQARMAERLNLSKGWLSKILKVAALPETIIAAYASPGDIALATAYPLAQSLDDPRQAAAIAEEAGRVADEQRERRVSGEPPLSAADVARRLLAAPQGGGNAGSTGGRRELFSWTSKLGRPGLSVLSANRQGVTLRLHAGSGATPAELSEAFAAALREVEEAGLGLQR